MKKLLILVITVFMLTLSSCDVINELTEGARDANTLAQDFCECIANEDYITVRDYMHPDSTPNKYVLQSYIIKLEENNNIDFSNGIAFKRRENFSSAYYDSSYGGTVHEFTYKVVVGNVLVNMFFVIVKNDNGYGIYSFGIEK